MRAAALTVVVSICGRAAADTPRPAITNGAVDDGDPAVIALIARTGLVRCTGTLVGPRVVLTAAHCGPIKELLAARVYFGGSVGDGGLAIPVIDARLHPSFDPALGGSDVALLYLADDPGVTPARLAVEPFDVTRLGAAIRVVGFGITAPGAADDGIKRQGLGVVDSFDGQEVRFHPGPSQPCQLDSGGPGFMMIGGQESVVGVTVRGDGACASLGVDLRVDAVVDDFIAPYFADAAPGAAAFGEPCFYPEHCASGLCVTAADDPRLTYCSTPCVDATGCPTTMACVTADGVAACRYPAPSPGAVGASCSSDDDCRDECGSPWPDQDPICTKHCAPDRGLCAAGQDCIHATGIEYFCVPGAPSSGCAAGLEVGGGTPMFVLLVLWRRRRAEQARERVLRLPRRTVRHDSVVDRR